jgi:DNA-directed RNA polymerase specialized sigma24 family protein
MTPRTSPRRRGRRLFATSIVSPATPTDFVDGSRRSGDIGLEILADRPESTDVEEATLELLGTERALALIRTLPQDQAEAIMLRAVIGLDAKSAGAILGKRPGAVRSAAHRGLKTLSQTLGTGAFLGSVTLSALVTLRR